MLMSYREYTKECIDGDNLEYSNEVDGNIGIFEPSDYNYFFSSGSKCSYLCSYETAKNVDLLKYKGAQVVVCCKRYAVIDKGEISFINQDFYNDSKEANNKFDVFIEKIRIRCDVLVSTFSYGKIKEENRYIEYNTVSCDQYDDVMKALDIAKAYSLEHNTRCVVAAIIFGYDRYMGFPF